jgi:hypothetical protein
MSKYQEVDENKIEVKFASDFNRGAHASQQSSIERSGVNFQSRNSLDRRDRQVITYDRPVSSKFRQLGTRRSSVIRDSEEDNMDFIDFGSIRPVTDVLTLKPISNGNLNSASLRGSQSHQCVEQVSEISTSLVKQKTRLSGFPSLQHKPSFN